MQAIFDESDGESEDDDNLISLGDDDFLLLERGETERQKDGDEGAEGGRESACARERGSVRVRARESERARERERERERAEKG